MMPTRLSSMFLATLILMGCGVVKVNRPSDPQHLLTAPVNLGFEEKANRDGAKGWNRIGEESGPYEAKLDEEIRRTGRYSAYVERKDEPDGRAGWQQGYLADVFAGKSVVIRGWIRTVDVRSCRTCQTQGLTQATAWDAGERGAWLGFSSHPKHGPSEDAEPILATWLTPHVTGSTDWTLFEATATLPENAEEAYLGAFLWGPGKAWFDDLEIKAE